MPEPTDHPGVEPSELAAKWALIDARVVAEVRRRGSLPDGELTEEEIARIAVAMCRKDGGDSTTND